jgi:hypothetical protein
LEVAAEIDRWWRVTGRLSAASSRTWASQTPPSPAGTPDECLEDSVMKELGCLDGGREDGTLETGREESAVEPDPIVARPPSTAPVR